MKLNQVQPTKAKGKSRRGEGRGGITCALNLHTKSESPKMSRALRTLIKSLATIIALIWLSPTTRLSSSDIDHPRNSPLVLDLL